MTAPGRRAIRWLSAADVEAAMPSLPERLDLARRTLSALAAPGTVEMPPKLGVHPRPATSWLHAMPTFLRGGEPAEDLVGMKWVAGFATNNALGIPALHAIVIVNDATTGEPVAILDGGPITAQRTAAVTGVSIAAFAPRVSGRPTQAAVIGAGVQGRAHIPVLGHLVPGVAVRVFDRHPERSEALAAIAQATPGIGSAAVATSARAAVDGADIVVTAASFAPPEARQVMGTDWVRSMALVVAVDYATYCSAELARSARLFLVDDTPQFLANRDAGNFDRFPDPTDVIGARLDDRGTHAGRVVVAHLGVGLADLIFADAIVAEAVRRDLGVDLPR